MSLFRVITDTAVSRHATPKGGEIAYGVDPEGRSRIGEGEVLGIAVALAAEGETCPAGAVSLLREYHTAQKEYRRVMNAYFDGHASVEDYSRARREVALAPASFTVHCPEITGAPTYTVYYEPHEHTEEAAENLARQHAAAEAGELHIIEYLPPAGDHPREPVYIRDVYGHASREHLLSLATDMERGL